MPDSEGKASRTEEILVANARLAKSVDSLGTKVDNIDRRGNHTRWGVYVLAVIAAVTLVLGGVKKLHDVNDRVDSAVDYNVASCASSNATRAEAKSLWDSVIQLLNQPLATDSKKPSAGLTAFTTALQAKVNKVYAQRDCEPVKNGSPAPAILPVPAPSKAAKSG